MKKTNKEKLHQMQMAIIAAGVLAIVLEIYAALKSASTYCKFNKALDIYISEHKYRVADYECMKDLCDEDEEIG